jgi:hypothetical protein
VKEKQIEFKSKIACAVCGILAFVIIINSTPICEKCHEESHPHTHKEERVVFGIGFGSTLRIISGFSSVQ